MSLSAAKLEALFTKTTDSDVLEALQYELNHRRSKPAKKLLIKVNEKLGVAPEVTTDSSKWKYEYIQLKKCYDLLRSTFTVEGEILARWGMTSAMPQELEAKVFGAWSKRLTNEVDKFERTKVQISIDIEKLKTERMGMNPMAITNLNSIESTDE